MTLKLNYKFKHYKRLVILLFLSYNYSYSQNINLDSCDTITSIKDKYDCTYKVYNQSQNKLDKTYNSLLSKLDKKIKVSKFGEQKKINSLKQFIKDTQTQWILTRDYNAKVHASYQLTTLLSENAFYRSKASESITRNTFLKTLIDSLNIN